MLDYLFAVGVAVAGYHVVWDGVLRLLVNYLAGPSPFDPLIRPMYGWRLKLGLLLMHSRLTVPGAYSLRVVRSYVMAIGVSALAVPTTYGRPPWPHWVVGSILVYLWLLRAYRDDAHLGDLYDPFRLLLIECSRGMLAIFWLTPLVFLVTFCVPILASNSLAQAVAAETRMVAHMSYLGYFVGGVGFLYPPSASSASQQAAEQRLLYQQA